MGSMFYFFLIILAVYTVILITKILNLTRAFNWLKKRFLYNTLLRFFLEGYL